MTLILMFLYGWGFAYFDNSNIDIWFFFQVLRIAQELSSLSTSLPLELSSSIFVRTVSKVWNSIYLFWLYSENKACIPQFFSLSGWRQNNSNESFNHWVSLPIPDTRVFCLLFPLFSESVLYAWFFQLTMFEIVLSVLKEPHTLEVVLYLTFISHRCTHKPHPTSTFRPQEGAKSDLIPTCMRMCPFIYWIFTRSPGSWFLTLFHNYFTHVHWIDLFSSF